MKVTKGFKVTDNNMQCLGYQYELNKMFTHNGKLEICSRGFHFCQRPSHCFNYYDFNSNNRVFEIEAHGEIQTEGDKSCCLNIKFLREIEWPEVLKIVNEGIGNIGHSNTGDWNTGDWNTGYSNTGNRNTGAFCTEDAPFPMFDKPSNWTEKDFLDSRAYSLLSNYVETKKWIPEYKMSNEEKNSNPSHKTAEGYIKDIPFKEAFQNAWHNFDQKSREAFTSLPNFDAEKFEFITGVKID